MRRSLVRAAVKPGKKLIFSLLRKTGSDGDERTVSGRLFQTDAAAAWKARSPMVARTVRGATSADGRRGLRRAEDQTPGSPVQSRGDSDTLSLPAGTRSVQEPEVSVSSTTEAARGHIDEP